MFYYVAPAFREFANGPMGSFVRHSLNFRMESRNNYLAASQRVIH
jgi:hypothetical protein